MGSWDHNVYAFGAPPTAFSLTEYAVIALAVSIILVALALGIAVKRRMAKKDQ